MGTQANQRRGPIGVAGQSATEWTSLQGGPISDGVDQSATRINRWLGPIGGGIGDADQSTTLASHADHSANRSIGPIDDADQAVTRANRQHGLIGDAGQSANE